MPDRPARSGKVGFHRAIIPAANRPRQAIDKMEIVTVSRIATRWISFGPETERGAYSFYGERKMAFDNADSTQDRVGPDSSWLGGSDCTGVRINPHLRVPAGHRIL